MSDTEKGDAKVGHLSNAPSQSDQFEDEYTEVERKSLIRRIDRRLVTTAGALYCISLIDRTNVSAAALAGMNVELDLNVENRYSIITLIFFVSYIIFQPPSTIIIRKLGPRLHLSIIILLWGAVMIGMGFAPNFSAMAALRFVLGILEAGFFPSVVYLMSTWYTRYEIGKRYSFFYVIGCVASAFGGILAFGLMQLNGRARLTGWRWIFIIEGILTCALGVAAYWLLVDFPDSPRKTYGFLTEKERAYVVRRVNADRGDAQTPKFQLGLFLRAGKDLKIWGFAMCFCATTTISYALAYFLPLILNTSLGFDVGQSQCLVAPPYVFAGFVMMLTGWAGDKYKVRGPLIICNMVLGLIGLPIMGWHPDPKVRYFGVFLVTAAANSNVPAVMSWQANNIRGQWKRAFCSATLVGFGGIGGIAGSLVFRAQDAKTGYKPGLYACITACLINIVIVCITDGYFIVQNKKADRGEKELEMEDGLPPNFRYTL
ncbi:major facilitator superfamily domain-containing protein [Microdochium trichocladiopsis]|uniref:Major facilitator superfamily domain-containing protein n=1 Tax=Microdochium trichocladiopsis TaxID=1682393 RepID=A0A9P9BU95_9PEZI|nr:major facilitator superfamily domain-containing protein [Microdochium trichocladiopsis]KAH7037872.1 major facilitator superfamily domain-containing protein [Microdochium trichocladiopsis]